MVIKCNLYRVYIGKKVLSIFLWEARGIHIWYNSASIHNEDWHKDFDVD